MTKFITFLALSALATAGAFSLKKDVSSTNPGVQSRREWMTTSLVAGATLLTPLAAKADVTNKIASSAAIRNVKRSQKQLETLEVLAANSSYEELRAAIRVSPFAEVRKNCFVLVRAAEDGPDADKLMAAYKDFIKALELMDSTANLALRGRKVPEGLIYDNYKATGTTLADFLKVAEVAEGYPLQS